MMLSILALIAADIPSVPATPDGAIDFTWLFIKMLMMLGAICLLAVLILKFVAPRVGFMRRLVGGGFAKVIARQGLEPRKNLYLVGIGKRYVVIGTSEHGISPIMELTEEEAAKLDVGDLGGRQR